MAGTSRIRQSPANPPSNTPRNQGFNKIMSTLPSDLFFVSWLANNLSLHLEATNTSSISATSTRALRESQSFPLLSVKLQLVRAGQTSFTSSVVVDNHCRGSLDQSRCQVRSGFVYASGRVSLTTLTTTITHAPAVANSTSFRFAGRTRQYGPFLSARRPSARQHRSGAQS
jgi:hypothetical protein